MQQNGKTDILIFSGQSNMQGQTECLPIEEPVAGALEYRYLTNEKLPLCHPVGENIGEELLLGAHLGNGSLLPDFCRAYIAETGREVVAVHAAKGATAISQWEPGCARYQALVSKCRGAVAAVGKENIGKIWFVWLQGESDALLSTTEEQYKERLCALKRGLDADLGIDGFFLIRVGKFADDERDIPILLAQERLAETEDFTLLTRVTGVCTNDPAKWINPQARAHYNNAAMTLIGGIAGKNLGLFAKGLPLLPEEEPYLEVAVCS